MFSIRPEARVHSESGRRCLPLRVILPFARSYVFLSTRVISAVNPSAVLNYSDRWFRGTWPGPRNSSALFARSSATLCTQPSRVRSGVTAHRPRADVAGVHLPCFTPTAVDIQSHGVLQITALYSVPFRCRGTARPHLPRTPSCSPLHRASAQGRRTSGCCAPRCWSESAGIRTGLRRQSPR